VKDRVATRAGRSGSVNKSIDATLGQSYTNHILGKRGQRDVYITQTPRENAKSMGISYHLRQCWGFLSRGGAETDPGISLNNNNLLGLFKKEESPKVSKHDREVPKKKTEVHIGSAIASRQLIEAILGNVPSK